MTLLLAAFAVALGQFVKGVTGFGSALVTLPILAWLFGPAEAIFLQATCDVVGSGYLAVRARHLIRPALLFAILLPMLGGEWVGTELLAVAPDVTTRRILGVVVALLGADIAWRPLRRGQGEWTELPDRRAPILVYGGVAGFVGGVMGGLVGVTGPPVVLFMRRWFTPAFFRAQLIGVFFLGAVGLSAMCWARGLVEPNVGERLLLLVPAVVLGSAAGLGVSPHVSPSVFGRVVGVVLVGSGTLLAATA